MPDRGFELLRDLVHEQTGLYFDDGKADLFFGKLSLLIEERACKSLLDYYDVLKCESGATDEWGKLFDALTVQESFFWREVEQIRVLVDDIVPQYFNISPNDTLSIWSAACAGGCEPLTIAMALDEAGWFDRARIEICASDASPRAIETAKKGVYREHSFRRLPPALKEKYFVRGVADSRVSSALHSRIRWQRTNLMSEADIALAPMTSPVIFCRNVFIYFSNQAACKTISAFARTMPRPGYLFVGMAESLMKVSSDFQLREMRDAYIYVKS